MLDGWMLCFSDLTVFIVPLCIGKHLLCADYVSNTVVDTWNTQVRRIPPLVAGAPGLVDAINTQANVTQ